MACDKKLWISIQIVGLELDCIVGLRPRERRRKQPVRLDIDLGLDLSTAGRSGRITQTCDYDRLTEEVTTLLRFREYRLIEVAIEELAAALFGLNSVAEEVGIRLEKPAALHGRARSVAVQIQRRRAQYPPQMRAQGWGVVEVLLETHEAGLYLLHVEPGQELPPDHDPPRRQLEWRVAGELLHEGKPIRDCRVWPEGRPEPYQNRSAHRATLFACACPPLPTRGT